MKEFLRLFTYAFVAPFALVWGAWILTAFSFSVKEIFEGGWFWILSLTWWICAVPSIAVHQEMEAKKKERGW